MIDLEVLKSNIYISLIVVSLISCFGTYFLLSSMLGFKKGEGANEDPSACPNVISTIALGDSASTNAGTTADGGFIYADLSGAVKHPGVYKVPHDSRISDLVSVGGGFDDLASVRWLSQNLNLATRLKDSDKVYIPFEWDVYDTNNDLKIESLIFESLPKNIAGSSTAYLNPIIGSGTDTVNESSSSTGNVGTGTSSSTSGSTTGTAKININTADKTALLGLSGVGEVTATKIISTRPFTNLDDFRVKSAITTQIYNKIKDSIKFSD